MILQCKLCAVDFGLFKVQKILSGWAWIFNIQKGRGKMFFYEILAFVKFHKKADFGKICFLQSLRKFKNEQRQKFIFEKQSFCNLLAVAFCNAKTDPYCSKVLFMAIEFFKK